MWDAFLNWAKTEVAEVKRAPTAIVALLTLGAIGGATAMSFFHSERFAVLEQRIAACQQANAPTATPNLPSVAPTSPKTEGGPDRSGGPTSDSAASPRQNRDTSAAGRGKPAIDTARPSGSNVTAAPSGMAISGGTVNNPIINNNAAPPMPPVVEGVRWTSRQVPSDREDLPYAIEVTFQVAAPVQPFGIVFTCDQPLVEGAPHFADVSVFEMVKTAHVHPTGELDDGKRYYVGFASPAVTPQRPLLVTLFGMQPFKVLRADRLNLPF